MSASIWPMQIRLRKNRQELEIGFDDGRTFILAAEYLRAFSPSAEVQGHHPSQKVWVTGKEDVAITALESVGNYAIRVIFDDGHDTGIYSWTYLYQLGDEQPGLWQEYMDVLKEKGINRNRPNP